jgi:hypothetical protein
VSGDERARSVTTKGKTTKGMGEPSAELRETHRAREPELARGARSIPPNLHAEVIAKLSAQDPATGKVYTSRAVAAWLRTAHDVRCSHHAVLRVEAAASERGEQILVAALREELRDAVGPAKASVNKARRRLDELLATETDPAKVARGLSALTGALDAFTKLSGVAAPAKIDVTTGGGPVAITLVWPDAPIVDAPADDHAPDAASSPA